MWGKQGLQRAQILLRLLRTQKGFEQQWKHMISLSAPTGVRDLHFATGSQIPVVSFEQKPKNCCCYKLCLAIYRYQKKQISFLYSITVIPLYEVIIIL
uniref:Uncharacterized protein n=1 Tax=Arsenophonus endosymbiont of Trialeurodes vaporariorum TaxID=235567 RepID=A0A3B0M366_9GAMM